MVQEEYKGTELRAGFDLTVASTGTNERLLTEWEWLKVGYYTAIISQIPCRLLS